jgi:hypothetical protein
LVQEFPRHRSKISQRVSKDFIPVNPKKYDVGVVYGKLYLKQILISIPISSFPKKVYIPPQARH